MHNYCNNIFLKNLLVANIISLITGKSTSILVHQNSITNLKIFQAQDGTDNRGNDAKTFNNLSKNGKYNAVHFKWAMNKLAFLHPAYCRIYHYTTRPTKQGFTN